MSNVVVIMVHIFKMGMVDRHINDVLVGILDMFMDRHMLVVILNDIVMVSWMVSHNVVIVVIEVVVFVELFVRVELCLEMVPLRLMFIPLHISVIVPMLSTEFFLLFR